MPNGHTPPGACPTSSSTLSNGTIFALTWNLSLYFLLSTLAMPSVSMSTILSSCMNAMVLAIMPGSTPSASAAMATVAVGASISMILSPYPLSSRNFSAFSSDTAVRPPCCNYLYSSTSSIFFPGRISGFSATGSGSPHLDKLSIIKSIIIAVYL